MEEQKLHDSDKCYKLQEDILSKGSIVSACNSPLKEGDVTFGCLYMHIALLAFGDCRMC